MEKIRFILCCMIYFLGVIGLAHAQTEAPKLGESGISTGDVVIPLIALGDHDFRSPNGALKNARNLSTKGLPDPLATAKVGAGQGIIRSLGQALARALDEQDRFSRELSVNKNKALFGEPVSTTQVYDTADAYILTRTTSAVVRDPVKLAAGSGSFQNFIGPAAKSKRPELGDLSPVALKGLKDFQAREARELPEGDPLRLASEKGEKELLDAISAGVGRVEMIDTFQIPKSAFPVVNGQLQLPFPAPKLAQFRVGLPDDAGQESRAGQTRTGPVEKPSLVTSGKSEIHSRFMAGFTLGNCWTWERRWNYPSGFFRITLGASYGVGLRIPIEVRGEFSPTRAILKDTANRPIETTLSVSARAVDGDESFYRDAGIRPGQMFGAKEAVLEARFGYGYKFRALWEDISSRPFAFIGLDCSENFTPPTGRNGDAPVIEIPPRLTNTEFNFGSLEGDATFGMRLVGTGTVLFDYEAIADGRTVHKKKLESRSTGRQAIVSSIPAEAKEYGFRLKNPAYRYDLELVPTVRISASLHCPGWSRSISTGWIDLNSLSIDVGTVKLERHAGTRKSVSFEEGKKEFSRIEDTDYIPEAYAPFHITVNGKYLRVKGSSLVADGDKAGKESLAELGQVNAGLRTIRMRDANYGRGALIGVGAVFVVGGRLPPDRREQVDLAPGPAGDGEYFRIKKASTTHGEKIILIQSSKNGKYLAMRADKTLHAESEDIQRAARFKFWPER